MKILVLEDDSNRVKTFRRLLVGHLLNVCNNAEDAIEKVKHRRWDQIFLDHDLGGDQIVDEREKNTGSEVVREMVKDKSIDRDTPIIIHSLNHVAAKNMRLSLEKDGEYTNVRVIPFNEIREKAS